MQLGLGDVVRDDIGEEAESNYEVSYMLCIEIAKLQ